MPSSIESSLTGVFDVDYLKLAGIGAASVLDGWDERWQCATC